MSAESSVPPVGPDNHSSTEGPPPAPNGEHSTLKRGEQAVAHFSESVTGLASRVRSGVGGFFSRIKHEVGSIWDEAQNIRHGKQPTTSSNPPEPDAPKEPSR
jgi:hypothetical protein